MTEAPEGDERIRAAVARVRRAMTRMDSVGRGTARTRARIDEGLACTVEDGAWSFRVDMPEKVGGSGAAPDPGVYGRGALASCLAVGYRLWAAHEGVPIDALEVEVEADYDARPEYGMGEGGPGYEAVRWSVTVRSLAPEAEIRRVLALAESRSPWLAVFREPSSPTRTLRVDPPGQS